MAHTEFAGRKPDSGRKIAGPHHRTPTIAITVINNMGKSGGLARPCDMCSAFRAELFTDRTNDPDLVKHVVFPPAKFPCLRISAILRLIIPRKCKFIIRAPSPPRNAKREEAENFAKTMAKELGIAERGQP